MGTQRIPAQIRQQRQAMQNQANLASIRQQQALQAAPARLLQNEFCRQQGIGVYAGSASIPKPNAPMPQPLSTRAPTPTAARLQQTRVPMQPRSMNVRSQHIMAHGRPTQDAQPSPTPVRQKPVLTRVQQVGPRAVHGPTRPPLSRLARFNQQRAIENRQALLGFQLDAVKSHVISALPRAQPTPQLEAREMVFVTPASSRPTTVTNSVVSGDTAMSSLSSFTSESPGSITRCDAL